MKLMNIVGVLFCLKTVHTLANTCCSNDSDPPNVSNRSPVAWSVFPANQPITFKAWVDDMCGIASTFINIYGYALQGHVASATAASECPDGYFCLDYSFPESGQNWWSMEVVDNCGHKRIVGNSTFCIEACPRNLRAARGELQHVQS